MNFKRFAVIAALCTAALSAQTYRGTFTLPFDAEWGANHLPAGDYTITADMVGSQPVLNLTGNGIYAAVLAGPVSSVDITHRGHLDITDVNGAHVVTGLVAGTAGKSYSFMIPKKLSRHDSGVVALQKATIPIQQ